MTDLTGKLIAGRYRVDEFIGRGGMAEVYKVWDTRRSTFLAMKLLHADLALDRAFLRRFNREAETLARLQHPNIVRFYGLEQDGEQIFMLMDFIEGKSLKQLIFNANGPLTLAQVLNISRQICQALQYAHYEGFVHADVKPGNVLIDNSGRVMLNDFGIARMAQTSTATLGGAGTPAYMSPEQALSEKPTSQSDIYSLGILLFEMLTGERPFNGERGKTGGSVDERVRWEQIHQPAPAARDLNPNISPEVEAVVLKTLAKDPSRRYSSALEISQALEQAIQPESGPLAVKSKPITKEYEAPAPKANLLTRQTLQLGLIGLMALVFLMYAISNGAAWMSLFSANMITPSHTPTSTRSTFKPYVTPTVTKIIVPTATEIPSPTSTPLVPIVMAKDVSINCRYGPGTTWQAVSALVLGTPAEIAGKNSALNYTWWYIQDPLNPGKYCWVAVDVSTTYGNLNLLPVVPTPQPVISDLSLRTDVQFLACGDPNPVGLRGTLKSNGPATVIYQWEISGDANLTIGPASVVFDTADTRSVADAQSVKLDCGEYTLKLQVTSPTEVAVQERFSVPP